MKQEIKLKRIVIIHTPYEEPKQRAQIKSLKAYRFRASSKKALLARLRYFQNKAKDQKDIDGVYHIILIYCFNNIDLREKHLLENDFSKTKNTEYLL